MSEENIVREGAIYEIKTKINRQQSLMRLIGCNK